MGDVHENMDTKRVESSVLTSETMVNKNGGDFRLTCK